MKRLIALIYSRLSLSRSQRDRLKHFEISVLRHIRFAELREIPIEQQNFTNEHVIWLLYLEIYAENIVERGEIAPEEQFLLLFTIFCYLTLDFSVKTRIRFSLRDKRFFEITEVEITRVDCKLANYLQKLEIPGLARMELHLLGLTDLQYSLHLYSMLM